MLFMTSVRRIINVLVAWSVQWSTFVCPDRGVLAQINVITFFHHIFLENIQFSSHPLNVRDFVSGLCLLLRLVNGCIRTYFRNCTRIQFAHIDCDGYGTIAGVHIFHHMDMWLINWITISTVHVVILIVDCPV